MPVTRTRELTIVFGAAALVAAVAIAAGLLLPSPQSLPGGSSFSRMPDGSAAAFETLQRTGYVAQRSYEPLSVAPLPPQALLIIANPQIAASNQDRRAVQTFVAAGGSVLATGCIGATFVSSDKPAATVPFASARDFHARGSSPLTTAAPSVRLASGCGDRPTGRVFEPLYTDGHDAPVLAAHVGRGIVLWSAANTPFENSAIDTPGHLDLLLNLAGRPPRAIVWDEFYHGQRRSLWSYLAMTPAPWMLIQLALAFLVAVAAFGRRRLPMRATRVDPRTSPLEFVDTMAGLYARVPSAGAAVAIARERLCRVLRDATGLSRSVTDLRLAEAAAPRVAIPAADLRDLLARAERAGADPSTTPEHALTLVQRMQGIATLLSRT